MLRIGSGTMKNRYLWGTIVIVIILTAYIVLNSYHCFILKFTSFPKKIEKILINKQYDIVFLYGGNLCGICPSGHFLNKISENKYIIYIVPCDFSIYDIENLRYTFKIKNEIITGDTEINDFLKKISYCKNVSDFRKNFYLKLSGRKKIRKIILF